MNSLSRIIKKDDGAERAQSFDSYFAHDDFNEVSEEEAQTKKEIKQLRLDAQKEAEVIINQAKKDAVKEQQSGFEEGLRRGMETVKPLENMLENLVGEITAFKDNLPQRLEPEVVSIVLNISAKIIKDTLETDRDVIVRNVQHAFRELADKSFIKIRIHSEDYNRMNDFKPQILEQFHDIEKMEIVADESIDRGGAVIETNEGSIDATIKNQMQKLHGLISCETVASQMNVL